MEKRFTEKLTEGEQSMTSTKVAVLFVVLFVLVSTPSAKAKAKAKTKTSEITVTVTVVNNCAIDIDTDGLNFGTYDSSADLAGDTALSVQCTKGTTAEFSISQVDGTLINENFSLNYSVALSQTGASNLPYVGTGVKEKVRIYGKVEKDQEVPDGTYSGVMVISITF